MLQEFKEFALRGNVVDLAVGVIIGAAFGKIVESLVNDIIMPIVGAITGGLDFSNMYFMITGTVPQTAGLVEARRAGAVFAYGSFITVVVNFAIVAFVLFLVIKAMNQLKRKQEKDIDTKTSPPDVPADVKVLTEIRDILASKA